MNLKEVYNKVIDSHIWCDKGTTHSYIDIYDALFKNIKDKSITILEIGVFEGGSLAMWKEYFTNKDTKVIGFDLETWPNRNKDILNFICLDPKIEFIHGDATNPKDLDKLSKFKFDIIIDDASHLPEDQQYTIEYLWPFLKAGGIYIIEDIKSLDIAKRLHVNNMIGTIIDNTNLKDRYDDIISYWIKNEN